MSELRVGIGVDAHALVTGVPLVLGGVAFPDEPAGLAGHSDGDVIAHALIDALLGAANLGDIGTLFPSSAERWKGSSSLALLQHAYAEVRSAGWELVNADCVLVGERPRCYPSGRRCSADSRRRWTSMRRSSRYGRRRRTASASRVGARGLPRRPSHSCAARPEGLRKRLCARR